MDANHEDLVAQFTAVTGANPSIAQTALQSSNWNLEEAVSLFFAQNEEHANEPFDDDEPEDPISHAPSQPAASGSSSRRTRYPGGGPRAMTLRDLQSGGDDEDDEDDKKPDMFAGGEKSGLAVQNPGDDQNDGTHEHFRSLINRARQNLPRPPRDDGMEDEPELPSNFSGRAQTLGGDDAPSRVIDDPRAASSQRRAAPRITRVLHLWADGVSFEDGPLLRYDDPANQHIISEINQGRAPRALLDVEPGQEVDIELHAHKGENYVAPKKKYKPFGGQGQRLGSPTPGAAVASSSSATTTPAAPPAASSTSSSASQEMSIDDSQPTITLQIRLGDGTRLVSRFNTTHTIGDVYNFVNQASTASRQRTYALMTTFPSKELSDKSQVLGDMSDFKRGGTVVQKWL